MVRRGAQLSAICSSRRLSSISYSCAFQKYIAILDAKGYRTIKTVDMRPFVRRLARFIAGVQRLDRNVYEHWEARLWDLGGRLIRSRTQLAANSAFVLERLASFSSSGSSTSRGSGVSGRFVQWLVTPHRALGSERPLEAPRHRCRRSRG
jgi:hypothetical protein